MGHPAGRLPERPKPLALDLLCPGPLQPDSHLTKRSTQGRKLGRAAPGTIRRQWLHSSDVPCPPDQLLDRSAELPREVPAESDRGIEERSTEREYDQPQPGVVIPVEGVGSLELSDPGVELVRVLPECPPFLGIEPCRVDGLQQGPAGRGNLLDGAAGPGRPGARADSQAPAQDHQGRWQGAEADQDQQDSLMEGESHLFPKYEPPLPTAHPAPSPRAPPTHSDHWSEGSPNSRGTPLSPSVRSKPDTPSTPAPAKARASQQPIGTNASASQMAVMIRVARPEV